MRPSVLLLMVCCCTLSGCSYFSDQDELLIDIYGEPSAENEIDDKAQYEKAKTLTELGLAYYKLGRYEQAEKNLKKSLVINEHNPMTYQVMALIYVRRKIPERAQLYFDKAIQLAPKDFNILTDYGVFLLEQQRDKEAKDTFTTIIKQTFYKNKWVAFHYLGTYDLKNKLTKKAEIKFYQALKIYPSYAPSLLEMAKIRCKNKSWMSARAFIERYLASAGNTLEGLEWAIKIEHALDDKTMADKYELILKRTYPFSLYVDNLNRH